MLNNVRVFLHASPAFREAFDAHENGVAALYDMAEGQRPFYAALCWAENGIDAAMNRFNKRHAE